VLRSSGGLSGMSAVDIQMDVVWPDEAGIVSPARE
jgi:hypothetical protein